MKKLSRYFLAGMFALFVASPVLAVTSPVQPTANAIECEQRFLGIPPWFRGMTQKETVNGDEACVIKSPSSVSGGISGFIWTIVLNVIEMALVIAAYIAIFFIIYGGFQFITGGASSDTVARARKTIFNAVLGLVISLGAVAITNYIFGIFAQSSGSATINGETIDGIQVISGELLLKNILNIVYFIAGTVAVIVIIVAGMLYVTSSGDSGRVSKAKNLLTYSIVGLVIIIAAFAITNFIIGRFS